MTTYKHPELRKAQEIMSLIAEELNVESVVVNNLRYNRETGDLSEVRYANGEA